MSFTDFGWPPVGNPFAGIPLGDVGLTTGLGSSGFMAYPNSYGLEPLPGTGPVPETMWSTEGSVGGFVQPLAPGQSNKTQESTGAGSGDTDLSAAAIKKGSDWTKALQGLKAPEAPRPQTIRSPDAPRMAAQKSQLATLLASMGVSPQQILRLGQTFGR